MFGRRRLDQAAVKAAEDALPPTVGAPVVTLRESLIAEHGMVVGDLLHEREMKFRQSIAAEFQRVKGELEAADTELTQLTLAQRVRLEPLRRAAQHAYDAWLAATEAVRRREADDDAEQAPLRTRRGELVTRISQPIGGQIRQWTPVNPRQPEAPPLKNDFFSR